MKKIIYILALVQFGCKVPQKTEEPKIVHVVKDTIIQRDTLYDLQGGEAFYEYTRIDSFYIEVKKNCPPATVINIKRNKDKAKGSYNYIGEINELKRSNQIKDSQIDSLTMQLGKKCVGNQTNIGSRWWIFVLLGMGLGSSLTVGGYFAFKSKKPI